MSQGRWEKGILVEGASLSKGTPGFRSHTKDMEELPKGLVFLGLQIMQGIWYSRYCMSSYIFTFLYSPIFSAMYTVSGWFYLYLLIQCLYLSRLWFLASSLISFVFYAQWFSRLLEHANFIDIFLAASLYNFLKNSRCFCKYTLLWDLTLTFITVSYLFFLSLWQFFACLTFWVPRLFP